MEEVNNQQTSTLQNRKLTKKGLYIMLAILLFLCLLVRFCFYIFTDESNVKNIVIKNNYLLSDEYIKELVDINYDDKYIFVFPSFLEMKAKKSELIQDITIKRDAYNTVVITVYENRVLGYCFDDKNNLGDYSDDYMQLILSNKTKILFENKYVKGYGFLSKFTNISDDIYDKVVDQLNKVSYDVLSRISEIRKVKFSYDENMIKLTMIDGYTIYTSLSTLDNVTYYLEIITNSSSEYRCIYIYQVDSNYNANIVDCKEFINESNNIN